MAIELKFHKTDNTPWGFRLTGGADCDVPLTVIKVTEGSIADINGLKLHDVIVRINDQTTIDCTHAEVHDLIFEAGEDLVFAVRRDYYLDDEEDDENNNTEVSQIMENSTSETIHTSEPIEHKLEAEHVEITDEMIAEAISGEAEVIPGQNVLGVNFNKVDLSQSTILKVMEEQHTKELIDLKERKWSAFLQKPERPILKPKSKELEQPKAAPYQVIIKKQKRKGANRIIDPEENFDCQLPENLVEQCEFESINNCIDESNATNAEEDIEVEELNGKEECVEIDDSIIEDELDQSKDEDDLLKETDDEGDEVKPETPPPPPVDEQLAQVQMQLQALAQLPSTIQETLDAVTKQLARILNTTQLRTEENALPDSVHVSRGGSVERTSEGGLESDEGNYYQEDAEHEEFGGSFSDISERDSNYNDEDTTQVDVVSNHDSKDEVDLEEEFDEQEQERLKVEAEKTIQLERKVNPVEEFHQRRLEQRPTNPLAPLQRPIILPGGRRWSQPNDALPARRKKSSMSDEKIIETLDTYSETLVGHTKGINFLKYQPPPKNLDYLQRSEVYKLIHDTDPPHRGIATRPEIVASEQDYYSKSN